MTLYFRNTIVLHEEYIRYLYSVFDLNAFVALLSGEEHFNYNSVLCLLYCTKVMWMEKAQFSSKPQHYRACKIYQLGTYPNVNRRKRQQ